MRNEGRKCLPKMCYPDMYLFERYFPSLNFERLLQNLTRFRKCAKYDLKDIQELLISTMDGSKKISIDERCS